MNISETQGTVSLSGDVTAAALNQEHCRRLYAAVAAGVHTVDLHAVARADSACVALLLALRRRRPQLRFAGLPEDVRKLSALYETDAWIAEESIS